MDELNQPVEDLFLRQKRILRGEYPYVFDMLNKPLKEFFVKHGGLAEDGGEEVGDNNKSSGPPMPSFPALDVGARFAAGTIALALHTSPPLFPEGRLVWYPSDWNGCFSADDTRNRDDGGPIETDTRRALRFLVQQARDRRPLLLGDDQRPVFAGESVELHSLNSTQFNGHRGLIQGPDPHSAGRFAVKLDYDDVKSFKEENLRFGGATDLEELALRFLRETKQDADFYQGFLDRTREVDVLRPETWSTVLDEIGGKCALVTCTSLLSCLGYRDPTAWQDTMVLASKLLCSDGFLLQFDFIGVANFGCEDTMKGYAEEQELGLALEKAELGPFTGNGNQYKSLLWKKC